MVLPFWSQSLRRQLSTCLAAAESARLSTPAQSRRQSNATPPSCAARRDDLPLMTDMWHSSRRVHHVALSATRQARGFCDRARSMSSSGLFLPPALHSCTRWLRRKLHSGVEDRLPDRVAVSISQFAGTSSWQFHTINYLSS